ncbi:PREDICTED: sister chromatid cohesion 1 protein 1 [Nelumbo nucifera]|uniref:Sister chromatid cohesion 1 protein 1 n=1 Tax=Nelumbo nucifera TaxID=4432 RepID=A0A1U8Q3U0_NELNU|nr:PREDICTED: sister chromatid cohesion 1 protein 1 [Nelumbo nucifera]
MFYSHHLLARKAPLGQIWMAATMHAKINRRKLDKLNIITICEEILNPSVPMALRLSGILMGGVVIVYERKVKLLYDDVTRLLVEINEAWKVKPVRDPTVLPKGKSQAKYEAVTLPANEDMETGEMEHFLHFSDTTTEMKFQQAAYFTMRLDDVGDPFVDDNARGDDLCQHHHQADAANITLLDPNNIDTDPYNRFERFDAEGEEETYLNFTPRELSQVPVTLIPSPPKEPHQDDNIQDQHREPQEKQPSNECRAEECQPPQHDEQRQGPKKRKSRKRSVSLIMDYEQTIIPGQLFQSWLQNPSDIVSRIGGKRKHMNPSFSLKITELMELPPVALLSGFAAKGTRQVHYPAPLLEQWLRFNQLRPAHDSPSGQESSPRNSLPHPTEPSSSRTERTFNQNLLNVPTEDFQSEVGSQPPRISIEEKGVDSDNIEVPWEASIEKLRAHLGNVDLPREDSIERLRPRTNIPYGEVPISEANFVTPRNSGDKAESVPSSASRYGSSSHDFQLPSGRSHQKRPHSSPRHNGSGLEPVDEENPWQPIEPSFKLRKLSENGPTPDFGKVTRLLFVAIAIFFIAELLEETGPTPTQHPIVAHTIDKITDSIRKHLKAHFDTPGAPQAESLNQLVFGMDRTKASQLFYQICVLATYDQIRVEQTVAYGDILISRGSKM